MSKLIIICGLSFSGKSTLGNAIAKQFGHKVVDVDETKTQLFGLGVLDKDLSHEQWVKIYDETDKQMEKYVMSGESVIDASRNFRKAEREKVGEIAKKSGAELVTVYIDTPEEIVHERMLENRTSQVRKDITDKDFEEILQVMEVPAEDENTLVFHYDEDVSSWIVSQSLVLN